MKLDEKKTNRVLNIILSCQVVCIIIFILSLLMLNIEFNDAQRQTILKYKEEDKIIGLTAEECIECFGEPLTISPNGTLLFNGGSSKRVGLACEYYEFQLIIGFDDNGQYADDVTYKCTMERLLW